MENKIIINISWKNADIYSPVENEEPVVYYTINNKIGTLKNTNSWSFYKEKYKIKWWIYQYEILPIR